MEVPGNSGVAERYKSLIAVDPRKATIQRQQKMIRRVVGK